MPDPLSVAASVAGIASLGIQVCQGLITYLRAIEGRKQEVSHGLREIQTLVSMFYSLNTILPQVDQRGVANSAATRQCLKDSEIGLLEFQQLLVNLRGPENQTGIREKMKEAGRLLTFPFCKEKLASLRDTLQKLLDNLNSAIHITSLDEVRDLRAHVQDNFDQLGTLQSTVTNILNDLKQQSAQTERTIQDFANNALGHLTLIQTDVQSIVSTNLVTYESAMKVEKSQDIVKEKVSGQFVKTLSISLQEFA
ncbi:hypothetical protein N0V83_004344 [Neocucurbitaria cava]|uniref:Fungal N-terminal domain-containing protein n=1 Tax=Neocucurbitaria cava TaxID=798079 RepID=A0A9W9CME8_9PLEO|nr:hypothetical protein N0V83_004344 [Neocucurbitaria cava]